MNYDMFIPNRLVYDMLKQKESNACKINLDKRLTHSPFTIFELEKCEKYIGKEGLFSDCPYDFEDIKKCSKGTLTHLASVDGFPFGSGSCDFKYFYPKEELEEQENENEKLRKRVKELEKSYNSKCLEVELLLSQLGLKPLDLRQQLKRKD